MREDILHEAIRMLIIHDGQLPPDICKEVIADLTKLLVEEPVLWRWRKVGTKYWNTQVTEVQPEEGYEVEALYRG